MIWPFLAILVCGISASEQARPNIVLICIDDLRPELGCYGVDYIHSPNIDALAKAGIVFERHYVQAPTCGASRYALLTGQYGGNDNGALFRRAQKISKGNRLKPSMPAWFRSNGYKTVAVGKVSHHPGGRGGPNWNDAGKLEMPQSWDRQDVPAGDWLHPRGWMHGLANGEIRKTANKMDVFQSFEGEDVCYPDGMSVQTALSEIKQLSKNSDQPFFLAVGLLRPHLPFGIPAKDLEIYRSKSIPDIQFPHKPAGKTTWHRSGEFMQYNRWGRDPNQDPEFAELVRKHYAACVTFADRQVGQLVSELKRSGVLGNTVIVLWGDHGWHLGEHAVWGKHTLFEESLRSPLMIAGATGRKARRVTEVVETVDLFPTLCEITGLSLPQCDGESLLQSTPGRARQKRNAVSYIKNALTIRNDRFRLTIHNDRTVELYDHHSAAKESLNVQGTFPKVVAELRKELTNRLPGRLQQESARGTGRK